jgi:NhaP-type Na+/H+ or K+/H+ antiporter
MVVSLGIIGLVGLGAYALFQKIKLPGILGLLFVGVLLGPYGLDLIQDDLLLVSSEFRRLALIVILLRAGLGIKRDDLNAVGVDAVKLSVIPGVFEGVAIMFLAQWLFGLSLLEGGMLGFILAAVSPAVIVPFMLHLQHVGLGVKKRIPTMILAAASIDDVVAITIFSAIMGMYLGSDQGVLSQLISIPLAIVLGVLLGFVLGAVLVYIFRKLHIRDTKKIVLLLATAIMMTGIETWLEKWVSVAGLIGVMTIGFVILEKLPIAAGRLAQKMAKVWIFAEILLFVLVGAQVNVFLAFEAGLLGMVLIGLGLMARSLGVYLSLMGSSLNGRERLFCMISFMPKATVQAAIGAIPLSLGAASGDLILALAVLAIVITAPLGALGLSLSANRLLREPH